jgi:hypothetical protein
MWCLLGIFFVWLLLAFFLTIRSIGTRSSPSMAYMLSS